MDELHSSLENTETFNKTNHFNTIEAFVFPTTTSTLTPKEERLLSLLSPKDNLSMTTNPKGFKAYRLGLSELKRGLVSPDHIVNGVRKLKLLPKMNRMKPGRIALKKPQSDRIGEGLSSFALDPVVQNTGKRLQYSTFVESLGSKRFSSCGKGFDIVPRLRQNVRDLFPKRCNSLMEGLLAKSSKVKSESDYVGQFIDIQASLSNLLYDQADSGALSIKDSIHLVFSLLDDFIDYMQSYCKIVSNLI